MRCSWMKLCRSTNIKKNCTHILRSRALLRKWTQQRKKFVTVFLKTERGATKSAFGVWCKWWTGWKLGWCETKWPKVLVAYWGAPAFMYCKCNIVLPFHNAKLWAMHEGSANLSEWSSNAFRSEPVRLLHTHFFFFTRNKMTCAVYTQTLLQEFNERNW